MARQGRVQSEMGIYHVLLRGINSLFENEADYAAMCDIFDKYAKDGQFRLIGYALLKNRVHIILNTLGKDIGIALKPVCTSYARHYNRTHGVDGKLFYDRFKSEPINSKEELSKAEAFVNAAAIREDAVRASLSEIESGICDYRADGLTEEEFKDTKITSVFLEDYECLSEQDIEDIIYALAGIMPEEFAGLTKAAQQEIFLKLTEKRWLAKTKLNEILGVKKSPKPMEKNKEEKSVEKPKSGLSVWLL